MDSLYIARRAAWHMTIIILVVEYVCNNKHSLQLGHICLLIDISIHDLHYQQQLQLDLCKSVVLSI